MNIKELKKQLCVKEKELDNLEKRKLPVVVGRMSKNHFQDNFRESGFVNNGLYAWPSVKRRQHGDAVILV